MLRTKQPKTLQQISKHAIQLTYPPKLFLLRAASPSPDVTAIVTERLDVASKGSAEAAGEKWKRERREKEKHVSFNRVETRNEREIYESPTTKTSLRIYSITADE